MLRRFSGESHRGIDLTLIPFILKLNYGVINHDGMKIYDYSIVFFNRLSIAINKVGKHYSGDTALKFVGHVSLSLKLDLSRKR